MAKIFTNSYVRPVYYNAGDVNGQKVFRRAPFDVAVIDGQTNLQPRSIMGTGDQAFTQLGRDRADEIGAWRDNDLGGLETLEPIVLNENQMGDWSDSWMGLHRFDNI